MIKIVTTTVVTVLVMSGCASNVPKPKVSENKTNYDSYTCEQLNKKYDRNKDSILQLTTDKNQNVNTGFNKIMWGNLAPMVAGGDYDDAIAVLRTDQDLIRQTEQKKGCM